MQSLYRSMPKQLNIAEIFLVVVGAVLLRLAYLVVYRLYFHPLASFPGPKLAALSDLWTVWYSVKGQSHLKAYEVHEKFGQSNEYCRISLEVNDKPGPIVRFGPNKLSISSLTDIEAVYRGTSTLKSEVYATINPTEGAFSTFTSINKGLHRRKRKVFSQAFSDAAISAFEPTISRHCDIFVAELTKNIPKNLKRTWSTPINMTPRSRYYATDIMGDFGFGKPFDMQTSEQNHFLMKATDGATVVAGIYCQYPKLKQYGMGRLVALAGMATKERFGMLAKRLIDDRLSDTSGERRDLLHFITTAKEKNAVSVSMDEIWAESRFTLIAGAETTGTALSSTLFYLSRSSSSLNRLQSELRHVFTSADDINLDVLRNQCGYLWACIDEAMRLSPSVVAVLWRQVIAEDFFMAGKHLPKGCNIGFSSYVPHHDAHIFPDPFDFKPERWLAEDNDDETLSLRRRAFTPFGLGPRKCIGMQMAYSEIALCLAKVLWMFDVKRPDGELGIAGGGGSQAPQQTGREREDEFQIYEHITCRHDGPYLQWTLRE